ncbi:MAG: DNA topoisomerase [Candidatus Thiodiazotropha taylori]
MKIAGLFPETYPLNSIALRKAKIVSSFGFSECNRVQYMTLFLFQLSPDCRYLQTTVFFEIGAEKFSYTGKQLIDPGYTSVMPWQALTSDEKMPEFKREQICPVNDVSICTP